MQENHSTPIHELQRSFEYATTLHSQGSFGKAIIAYEKLIKNHREINNNLIGESHINLASIYRKVGKKKEAVELLEKVKKCYPNRFEIWNNLGNTYRDLGEHIKAIFAYRMALILDPKSINARLGISKSLVDQGYYRLCIDSIKRLRGQINSYDELFELLKVIMQLVGKIKPANPKPIIDLLTRFTVCDDKVPLSDSLNIHTSLASLCIDSKYHGKALYHYFEAVNQLNTLGNKKKGKINPNYIVFWHGFCWNFGISLIKNNFLKLGWHLYEHGLRVPADGKQKYQRACIKPYSNTQVPLWHGESLEGKHILIFAEQAIGDCMMFFSALPSTIFLEADKVSVTVPNRLVTILEKSYPDLVVYDECTFKNNIKTRPSFDYMIPCGSVIQHRFEKVYKTRGAGWDLRAGLDKDDPYAIHFIDKSKIYIGISWQGGGRADRIHKKSMNLNLLLGMINKFENKSRVVLVDMQYGETFKIVQKAASHYDLDIMSFAGVTALGDNFIDWMHIMNNLDLVISIANTTIHASASLLIPTLCLLTEHADWRWPYPEVSNNCPWYSNVDILFNNGDWLSLERPVLQWLSDKIAVIDKP